MGALHVASMKFSSDPEHIRKWLHQTGEMMDLMHRGLQLPDKNYTDAKPLLDRVKAEGSWLSGEEWFRVRQMLDTAANLKRFFKERQELFPLLFDLAGNLPDMERYVREIDRCVDEEGQIKSNASSELYTISKRIQTEEQKVRKQIQSIAKKVIENGWGPENAVTIRNDRQVLAIFSEHKRKITGLVHDESATGQTFYIEPSEIFELNNLVRELYLEKQREIRRILIQLTNYIRPAFPEILLITARLGIIDFIRAKALFSGKIKAAVPQISDKPGVQWLQGRHPLLLLHHRKSNKKVIPFDLTLHRDKRIIVISGPNAGGKSVLLKAAGLMQLMVQHGIPVSASPDSRIGIFKNIFADIGDQQSIDNDLSTYSSHLTNMKQFVNYATSSTLFLIDEMGTGTDPLYGGPMAEAVLEQLNRKWCYGLVTTHFSNLKIYASKTPGLGNGSMVFDQEQLQPLYQFDDGKPGSSYTFEIASKTGVQQDIIQNARKKIGSKNQQADKLLIELEREKTYIKNLKEDLDKEKIKSAALLQSLTEEKASIEEKKEALLKQYRTEALQLVSEARKHIENTIREIRETQAGNLKQSREPLEHFETSLKKATENAEISGGKSPKKIPAIRAGDWVVITESGQEAEVLSVTRQQAELALGGIIRKYALEGLEKTKKPGGAGIKKQSMATDLNQRMVAFNGEINIIGMRGDEALTEVMQFVDEAIMLGYDRIRIVHGRGSGILKKLIRGALKNISSVASVSDEQAEFGGDAITIVKLI